MLRSWTFLVVNQTCNCSVGKNILPKTFLLYFTFVIRDPAAENWHKSRWWSPSGELKFWREKPESYLQTFPSTGEWDAGDWEWGNERCWWLWRKNILLNQCRLATPIRQIFSDESTNLNFPDCSGVQGVLLLGGPDLHPRVLRYRREPGPPAAVPRLPRPQAENCTRQHPNCTVDTVNCRRRRRPSPSPRPSTSPSTGGRPAGRQPRRANWVQTARRVSIAVFLWNVASPDGGQQSRTSAARPVSGEMPQNQATI